jgi:hypothetical protein
MVEYRKKTIGIKIRVFTIYKEDWFTTITRIGRAEKKKEKNISYR